MTQSHFQAEIGRLEKQFGKYGTERCILLWKEVWGFSDRWMSEVIDRFIGNFRHIPLIQDFQEEIIKEREHRRQLQKEEEKEEARDFWDGTYHKDEVREIMKTIKERILGQVSNEEYGQFIEMLDYAAEHNPKVIKLMKCRTCEDLGFVFHRDEEDYEWTYRCYCESGQKKSNRFKTWHSGTVRKQLNG